MGVLPMSVQTQTLLMGDKRFKIMTTSHVEGAEALPHSLRILRKRAAQCRRCRRAVSAKRIVDAGTQGVQGGEIEYMPARSFAARFHRCQCSLIWL